MKLNVCLMKNKISIIYNDNKLLSSLDIYYY